MRMDRAIYHCTNRRWTHEKAVVVVVDAGVVPVVVETELGGVALGDEILDVQIRDIDLLSAFVK